MAHSNFTIRYSGENHSMTREEVYGFLCQTEGDFDLDATLAEVGWCSAHDERYGNVVIVEEGSPLPAAALAFLSNN